VKQPKFEKKSFKALMQNIKVLTVNRGSLLTNQRIITGITASLHNEQKSSTDKMSTAYENTRQQIGGAYDTSKNKIG